MLSQKIHAILKAGEKILSDLISNPTMDQFILSSNEFTRKVGLWSVQLKKFIENLPDGVIGAQIMLGESIFLFYQDYENLFQSNIPLNLIREEEICQNTVIKC